MKETEFYATTPRTFNNILIGYSKQKTNEFRESWEIARAIIVGSLSPHLPKGSSKSPLKLYPFPWDKEREGFDEEKNPIEAHEKAKARWEKIDGKK